ncbi:hypothetical protein [Staphylococcus caprae]|uniref:hypothetical protein n=1 Tax=Staphylococcus caprae TaxID=29380 RepID=UPI001187D083|nr:hypothetical protein [Staphylococcus caprae]QDW94016.1 hypothetical protein DWB96_07235 [Staphylococcus caprae]
MNNKTLNAVPNRQNTIISNKQVASIEPIFARPTPLAKIFALSPSTTHKYIREAEESKDFSYIVKKPSPSIVIVEIEGFKSFLEARQKKSFQKINK